MRTGLSTIQQTLTPEAASILSHSIAEAGRRNHGQTTPLHVAATLLASPSGFLRQACIRSHPNSSHPLQCRALELCFSVALERLPAAQNPSAGTEPPVSNALMAALKRAQAHQRRGCPDQQQQPLLAVKVELDQLIISILDDPSVSRVMREASFSSPAVKATIEQTLSSPATSMNPSPIGVGFRPNPTPMAIPNRNLYLNPRLQQQGNSNSGQSHSGQLQRNEEVIKKVYLNPRLQQGNLAQSVNQRNEEVKKVIDILMREEKRNPVLVGELEPEAVIKVLLRKIENGELGEDGPLKNVQVIPLEKEFNSEKSQIPNKIKELGSLIETRIANSSGGGIVLDLGDLKWLVEQPGSGGAPAAGAVAQQVVSESGRAAVVEMGKILARFRERNKNGGVWLIGTATCETYLRCQVYHPSMENDWDLQAVPIASRSHLPGMFPRMGSNGIISSLVESLTPLKSFANATNALPRRLSENLNPARKLNCCPQCTENCEQELAKMVPSDSEKSSSDLKSEAARSPLPQWLQNAKVHPSNLKTNDRSKMNDEEMILKQKTQELQKKWSETCLNLHPSFHKSLSAQRITPTPVTMTGLYNPNLLGRPTLNPKLQPPKKLGENLQLNPNPVATQPSDHPGSPVRTDLVLGPTKTTETSLEKTHEDRVKDLLGCISSGPDTKVHQSHTEKFASILDADTFKRLLKGLSDKVWWQKETASAVATAITRCRSGNGKRRGGASKGDIWILFTGPDRAGKKKMASVISDQVCGANPVTICLGSRRDDESDLGFRGRTALDRIVEAVRRNPFSVIVLEDIDEADILVRGSIKRAMERGRFTDSHGREISLGNIIFILTGNYMSENHRDTPNDLFLDENRLSSISSGGWNLRLCLGEKSAKRRANWLFGEDRATKARRELGSGLSFDLNEAANTEDDNRTNGSHDSSDLTNDYDDELGIEDGQFAITSVPHDLINFLDDAIVFKPVKTGPIRRKIENTIKEKFSLIVDDKLSIELHEGALEKILGGVWLGRTSLEDWAEKVMVPSFQRLRARLPNTILNSSDESLVVRLEPNSESQSRSNGDWLPSEITVIVDAL